MGTIQQACCKKRPNQQANDDLQDMTSSIHSLARDSLSKPQMEESQISKMTDQVNYVKLKFSPFKIRFQQPSQFKNLTEKEIWPIKLLGRGAFGKVYLVRLAKSPNLYALKQIKKKFIVRKFQVENLMYEKMILQCHDHPFIVKLHYAFQDKVCVNFLIDFVQGGRTCFVQNCQKGELFHHLKKRKKFNEESARFYSAQIILALEYLHKTLKVIYRDLKPENILIGEDGYIKLTDFGLSKSCQLQIILPHNKGSETICQSFCGTPEYLAPEIIQEIAHNEKVDIWTLGCLIYEIIFGQPPFRQQSRKALYDAILKQEITFPSDTNPTLVNLINSLMDKNVVERIFLVICQFKNRPDIDQIKLHPFYAEFEWEKLMKKELKPPFIPILMNATDTRNFDYLKESAMLQSITKLHPSEQEQALFDDFEFIQTRSLLKINE